MKNAKIWEDREVQLEAASLSLWTLASLLLTSCFSHWGGRRFKIFFFCTILLAWTIQKVVGGASGKHTPCTLQHESTTGEWWNFSWNLVLTRIRLLNLLSACSQHQATDENSLIRSCMIRNYHVYKNVYIYLYIDVCVCVVMGILPPPPKKKKSYPRNEYHITPLSFN